MTNLDPNTLMLVIGSISVALISAGPLWISQRMRRGRDDAQAHAGVLQQDATHAITELTSAVSQLQSSVITQGTSTMTALNRMERKIDEHIKLPHPPAHTAA